MHFSKQEDKNKGRFFASISKDLIDRQPCQSGQLP